MLMTYKYTMFIVYTVYTLQDTHMKNDIQMWFFGRNYEAAFWLTCMHEIKAFYVIFQTYRHGMMKIKWLREYRSHDVGIYWPYRYEICQL